MKKHTDNFKFKNSYDRNFLDKKKEPHKKDGIQVAFVEVTAESCKGDFKKMVKKFSRKVRNEEVLRPFYDRLAYFQSKGQKKRKEKLRGTFIFQKNQKKKEEEDLRAFEFEKIIC